MRSSTCGQIEARRSAPGGGSAEVVLDDLAERGHVGDGDDDVEVPLLGRRRADDVDRPTAREVAGHLVDGLDRGRQPDALGGPVEERVEPLEREGEVGAALGAGDGVDLVEDDRLDAAQRLARLRGEEEEERLGRGDEDVAGRPREGASLGGGGVAAAHRHGDVGLGVSPSRVAAWPMPTRGLRRLRSTSTASAFIGET